MNKNIHVLQQEFHVIRVPIIAINTCHLFIKYIIHSEYGIQTNIT